MNELIADFCPGLNASKGVEAATVASSNRQLTLKFKVDEAGEHLNDACAPHHSRQYRSCHTAIYLEA